MMEQLKEIADAFVCPGTYVGDTAYGSGHINDTYKSVYEVDGREVHHIRQRVNHHIFEDVPALMENIGQVTRHVRGKREASGASDLERSVLTLVPTLEGKDYYQSRNGDFWRSYLFIENAVGIDVVENTGQAFEAAKAFGAFHGQLADLPVRLHDTIPRFHHTRSRFETLIRSVERDACNRASDVKAEINFVLEREDMVDVVLNLLASGEIPERVTHNDTKLNNVLIDTRTGKGQCVIDLDTVMQGSILYDFGDLVRTTTTTVSEDERDLSLAAMNLEYFEALVKGYLETASGFLLPKERALLPFSGNLITLEIGMRFLTDYLEGDSYFKTHRPGQNLDRCRKQFKMVQSMEEQRDAMQKIAGI